MPNTPLILSTFGVIIVLLLSARVYSLFRQRRFVFEKLHDTITDIYNRLDIIPLFITTLQEYDAITAAEKKQLLADRKAVYMAASIPAALHLERNLLTRVQQALVTREKTKALSQDIDFLDVSYQINHSIEERKKRITELKGASDSFRRSRRALYNRPASLIIRDTLPVISPEKTL